MSLKRGLMVILITILALAILMLSACTAKPDQVSLEILSGGDPNLLGLTTGLADQLMKKHPWIRASVTEQGGDEDTLIQAVGKDPTTIFSPNSYNYWGARYGVGPWTTAYPNVRLISAHVSGGMFMQSNDPDVRELTDLVGRKVVGLTGSVTTAMLEGMLEAAGIRDQVDIEMQGYGAQFDSFRDRLTVNTLDAMFVDVTTNTGHVGGFMEEALFALKGEVYSIDFPPELIAAATKKLGLSYTALAIPDGTMETQDRPWHGISHGGFYTLCTWAEADEEVIYEVTKIWMENLGELHNYTKLGGFITAESIMQNLPVASEDEVHPGALKYYKETGLWDKWGGPWGQ